MNINQFTENSITLTFSDEISEEVNRQVVHAKQKIEELTIDGITEFVLSYTSLIVYFDVFKITGYEVIGQLQQINFDELGSAGFEYKVIEIPVCYGGEYGPDIDSFQDNNLSPQDVIDLHSNKEYLVYMIGFMPGFPYLGGLDERLYKERLSNPRKEIPAGSVGIGGQQTGMYPFKSPGGWNLLGRTPVYLYDERRGDDAILYEAGDRIIYKPIDEQRFKDIEKEVEDGTYQVRIEKRKGDSK